MAITIDPIAKRIILDSTSTTTTEIYSRVVDWLAQADNIKYGMIIRVSGMDPLPGSRFSPANFFLQGDWRVRPMEANHTLDIEGNLYVEDGVSDPVVPTIGNFNVLVRYTVPVQSQGIAISGGTGPTASEIADAVLLKLHSANPVIPVDVKKMNGYILIGSGTEHDKWRGNV